ncbi:MAG TPA: hypothetical protein VFV99_03495 [Kofleriaceae bacterium]|nr:hypothetical protein [Kofleriaceae bacterium]
MRASTLGVVLLTAIMIAIACGPKQPPNGPKQDEITALWIQIRDWRREAGLPVDPRREDVISIGPLTIDQAKHVCPDSHPVPPSCGDVCSLAENICDNAESICNLADELGKDDKWAQDKCSNAKASCRDAKKRCCQCSETDSKSASKASTW